MFATWYLAEKLRDAKFNWIYKEALAIVFGAKNLSNIKLLGIIMKFTLATFRSQASQ